jgi:hypothetical protein
MLGKFVEWEQTGYGHILGIDIACDIPSNHEHIHQDHKTAERSILQRWRRSTVRRVRQNDTIYFNRKFRSRGLVIYSDKKAWRDGRPTLHIELRLRGGRTIRRALGKLDNLPQLADPKELARIFNKVVQFVDFSLETLGRAYQKKMRLPWGKTLSAAEARRIGGLLARLMRYDLNEETINATVIHAVCKKYELRPNRIFRLLITTTALPLSPPITRIRRTET